MSVESDWDVDSYKSEFESEEHWQLKRSFMLAHKDKFSEDELVCLAQVFTNIEFMGCRYPDKTMIRVAELAKGVVEKFREQRKNSLKRTFVSASDAASAKVKGEMFKGGASVSLKKIKKTETNSKETNKVLTEEESTKIEIPNTRVPKYGGVKTFNIKPNEQTKSSSETTSKVQSISKTDEDKKKPLGNFVLILGSAEEHPVNIIKRNSFLNKCSLRWEFERGNEETYICKLYFNKCCFATSTGSTVKMSREHTAMVAIAKLREHYYGIRVKKSYFSSSDVFPSQLSSGSTKPTDQLGEDNIGRKLMKLMGWEGGGLGRNRQGRENPITAVLHVKRTGLGLKPKTVDTGDFRKLAQEYIKNWVTNQSDQDLVFSCDFSSSERKILHEIALSHHLKSKSFGKEPNRRLTISRKIEPYEILKELLKRGGSSDKYELLHPINN